MPNVQIRNVSEQTVRLLEARAANEGASLSVYRARELERIADQPTVEELAARLRTRAPTRLSEASVDAFRAGRNER